MASFSLLVQQPSLTFPSVYPPIDVPEGNIKVWDQLLAVTRSLILSSPFPDTPYNLRLVDVVHGYMAGFGPPLGVGR